MIRRIQCLTALVLVSVICSSTIAEETSPHPTETTQKSTQNEATTVPNHILAVSSASSKENAVAREKDVDKAANELSSNEIKETNTDEEKVLNEVNENKARTMSPREIEQLHALMKSMQLNMQENAQNKKNKTRKMKGKKAYFKNREEDPDERALDDPVIEEERPINKGVNANIVGALAQVVSGIGPVINKKCYKAFMDGSERGPRIFGNMATTLDSRVMKIMLLFFRAPISLTSGGVSYLNCLLENAGARSLAAALKLANRARGGLKFVNRVIDTFLVNDRDLAVEMAREEAQD